MRLGRDHWIRKCASGLMMLAAIAFMQQGAMTAVSQEVPDWFSLLNTKACPHAKSAHDAQSAGVSATQRHRNAHEKIQVPRGFRIAAPAAFGQSVKSAVFLRCPRRRIVAKWGSGVLL